MSDVDRDSASGFGSAKATSRLALPQRTITMLGRIAIALCGYKAPAVHRSGDAFPEISYHADVFALKLKNLP